MRLTEENEDFLKNAALEKGVSVNKLINIIIAIYRQKPGFYLNHELLSIDSTPLDKVDSPKDLAYRLWLTGDRSNRDISREIGCEHSTINKWAKKWEKHQK